MEKFVVKGEVQLNGTIQVGGAKNAALPIMAATILGPGVHIIHNVPSLSDIKVMQDILITLGAKIVRQENTLVIDTLGVNRAEITDGLLREMRASVFLLGPLLGIFRNVRISYPGGCAIGPRPVDLHIKALEKIGAHVSERFGYIEARAECLTGGEIQFDFPSVGATENAMMAATLAERSTIIRNAAREPEIVELQTFLNKMGAVVTGAGTDTIRIDGVRKMHPTEHTILSDRIQAGTYLIAGAITSGDVLVENIIPETIFSVIDKLAESGCRIDIAKQSIRIRTDRIQGLDIKTLPYPGFPTDLQAPMLSLLTTARGTSIVTETIFENRFKHVDELTRMGAKIKVEGRSAIVRGVLRLTGARVSAPDLRAGGALVLAALAAEGTTDICDIYHIDRGYEQLEQNLRQLGADIIRKSC